MSKLKRKNFRFGDGYKSTDYYTNGHSRFLSCFFNLKFREKPEVKIEKNSLQKKSEKIYREESNRRIRRQTANQIYKMTKNQNDYDRIIFSDQKSIRSELIFA